MIKPDLKYCKDIHEFYSEICRLQAGAHSKEYLEHHKALTKCASEEGSDVVKEIGVCQGGTLAALLFTTPKKLIGIDVQPHVFTPYQKHFEKYAEENNIEFEYREQSSHDPKGVEPCDVLHIDSLHKAPHLAKELEMHAPHVRKYIVFHDTAEYKNTHGLFPVIAKYITQVEQKWQVVDHYIHRVGYTVIKRVDRKEAVWNDKKKDLINLSAYQ